MYVHIPFCVSVCPYCDFVVVAGSQARGPANRIAPLIAAVHTEIDLRADAMDAAYGHDRPGRRPLRSAYLGGGTPSLLAAPTVADILAHLERRFGLAKDAEVTLEANPGPDEIGDLAGFKAAGVNRLSIGAQSMRIDELRELGRRHDPADVAAAVRGARAAGFTDVSLDLLTDVPGQDEPSWRQTLISALVLEPDHLSIYSLSLGDPEAEGLTGLKGDHLPMSQGARRWRGRARPRQSQDRARRMDATTDATTAVAGFERYEIANLARGGKRSRHNLAYWHRRPYLGFGPGAHSFDGALRRTWNAANLDRYVSALAPRRDVEATLPPGGVDVMDADTAGAEAAMLGLRLSEGIDQETAARPAVADGLAWAMEHGLAAAVGDRIMLTGEGRALADEVFMRLLPPARTGGDT